MSAVRASTSETAWWIWTGVRAYRVTFAAGVYIAECNGISAAAYTQHAAVAIAAMRAHKARSSDPTPF